MCRMLNSMTKVAEASGRPRTPARLRPGQLPAPQRLPHRDRYGERRPAAQLLRPPGGASPKTAVVRPSLEQPVQSVEVVDDAPAAAALLDLDAPGFEA